jgi:hypothetical protein
MGLTPSLKLDQCSNSGVTQPQEYANFSEVRFENGPGNFVHLYLTKSDPSVAFHNGVAWEITDGAAIGDPALDGTVWSVILGQAK